MKSNQVFLIPVNFCEASYRAVEYGILLAKEFNCKLRLLHVVDINEVEESDNPMVVQRHLDYLIERADVSMSSFQEMIVDAFSLDIETDVVVGHVEYTLLREIRKQSPAAVVLGKKSKEGSLVRSMIRNVKAPLILVPSSSEQELKCPSRIVLATDKKPVTSFDLQFLAELARSKGSLSLLHVHPGLESNKQDLADLAGKFSTIAEIHSELIREQSNEVVNGVLSSLGFGSADLLCTIKRKRGYFGRFFEPPVAAQLAVQSNIPTLILSGS